MTQWFDALTSGGSGFSIVLLMGVAVVMVMLFFSLLMQNQKSRQLIKRIEAQDKKISVMSSGSLGLGQRLMALEKKLCNLQLQQEDFRQQDLEYAYAQAQKLIEQGVDARTVAANSGLSVSEVDLMQMLYGQGRQRHVA